MTMRRRRYTARLTVRPTVLLTCALRAWVGRCRPQNKCLTGPLGLLPCDCVQAALSADPKQKRRATVDMSAGAGGAATGDAGGKDAADPLSPTGRGGALLRRQTTTMETPSRGGWLANCLFCVCFRWGGLGAACSVCAATRTAPLAAPFARAVSDCWPSGLLVGRPCALLTCRNPKVIPRSVSTTDAWGDGGAGAGAGADATAAKASKRTLKRDSHDTLMLLTPFMLWSTLVFIFYAVSVAELKVRLGRRGCRAHGVRRCSCVACRYGRQLFPYPQLCSPCRSVRPNVPSIAPTSPPSSVPCR